MLWSVYYEAEYDLRIRGDTKYYGGISGLLADLKML